MGQNSENNTNWGCLVIAAIFVIINLIYAFSNTSSEELGEMGSTILGLAGLGIAGFILTRVFGGESNHSSSKSSQNEKFGLKGCLSLIGILLFFCLVVGVMTSSEELNIAAGILVLIVIAIGFGIWIYYMGHQ